MNRPVRAEDLAGIVDRWRPLLESLPDGTAVLAPDGTVLLEHQLFPDDGAQRPAGAKLWELVSAERRDAVRGAVADALRTRSTVNAEFALVMPDATTRWFAYRMGPITEGDKVTALIVTGRDITERKVMEEALRESEERFRTIAEGVPGVVNVRRRHEDGRWSLLYVGPGLEELVGSRLATALRAGTQELVGLIHPEDLPQFMQIHERIGVQPMPYDIEYRLRTDDGAYRWVRSVNRPRIDRDGESLWCGLLLDLSPRKKSEERLQQAEHEKAIILDGLVEHVVHHDTTMRVIWANQAACESIGLTLDEVVGRQCYELWAGRNDICPDCPVAKAMETGRQEWVEKTTPDGRAWLIRGSPVRDNRGDLIGGVEVTLEVTERNRAEKTLRKSEKKFRELYEGSRDGFGAVDMDGAIIECNRAFQDMLGYTVEELRALSYRDITPPKWHAHEERILREQVLKTGYSEVYEKEYITKDGRVLPIEIRTNLRTDEEGCPIGMWGLVRDITERKKSEEALRDREARLRLMMAQMPAVVWVVNRQLRFTSSQGSALKALRLDPDEVIGQTIFEYFRTDDADFPAVAAHRRALRGESVEYESMWDGRVFASHVEPLRDAEGQIIGCVGVALDVTERNRAAEELRARAESERLLLRELDHRVRNNLASLISLINLSRRSTKDVDEFANSIRARTETMAMVHSLLSQRHWEPVPFDELLRSLVPPGGRGSLRTRGPALKVVASQAQALGMLINELMTNSLKYGALKVPAGAVDVSWVEQPHDAASQRLELIWEEHGGPVIAHEPAAGAGAHLIDGLVRSELRGRVQLTYPREGARHSFELTLDRPPGPETDPSTTPAARGESG